MKFFFAVVAIGLIVGAIVGGATLWDGSYYLYKALDTSQPYAPHGRFIVGTLIFQDMCVVPMVLVVPLLRPGSALGGVTTAVALAIGKAALVVVGTITVARFVVPSVLRWVDASRSREVLLLAILALCIGTAWLTSLAQSAWASSVSVAPGCSGISAARRATRPTSPSTTSRVASASASSDGVSSWL